MKRIYHPYWLWECYKNGMYRSESKDYEQNKKDCIINFMSNTNLFSQHMKLVTENWFYSCEHNLSNIHNNRIAWIGQAACNIEYKYPEYLVRKYWWLVDINKRNLADLEAVKNIKLWEQKKRLSNTLKIGSKNVTQMEFQMKCQ